MQTSKITIVSQFIFLVLLFLLPTLFIPLDFIALEPLKIFIFLMLGISMTMIVLAQKVKKNNLLVTKNLLWISMGTIVLSSLLSTVFSNNIGISLFGRQVNMSSFLSIVVLFLLSYSVSVLFTDAKQKGRFFLTFHLAMIFVMLMHVLNVLVPFVPALGFFVNNTINTIGKWYDLGFFAAFGMLSSVLVLQFLRHSKFYKSIGWGGIVLSSILVILVNSILVWAVTGVFALLYIVLNALIQKSSDSHDQMSYPALAILALSVIFILVGPKFGALVGTTFNFQFEEVRPTVASTIEVIGDTLRESPVVGVGLNRFETAWLKHKPVGVNTSDFWDTDFRYGYSNILSVPVVQGIVGGLAWIFFIIVSVYYAFRLLFVQPEQKSDIFMNLYAVLAYVFFLVTMILYVPSVVMIGLFFIFLGFFISNLNGAGLISYKEVALDKNPKLSFGYILALVAILIILIYFAFIVMSQYSSRLMFENASKIYSSTGDIVATENQVIKAQFVYSSDVYLRSLAEIGLIKIGTIINDTNLTQEQAIDQFRNTLQATVEHAQSAITYDQQSYANRLALVSIYKNLVPLAVPGAKEEAIRTLDEISAITPNNPSLNLEKARVYALAKEFDTASLEIAKALELKPNYVDAVFLLSQIQVEKGEIDQAVISIQAALSVQPYNPSLHFQLGLLKYNQEKFAEAITSFENAVIISPYFGNAKYFLGLSYYRNGRTSDAVIQFENLSAMYPQNSEVSFILNNLKQGKDPFDGVQPPLDASPESRDELPVEEDEPEVTEDEVPAEQAE